MQPTCTGIEPLVRCLVGLRTPSQNRKAVFPCPEISHLSLLALRSYTLPLQLPPLPVRRSEPAIGREQDCTVAEWIALLRWEKGRLEERLDAWKRRSAPPRLHSRCFNT